MSEIKPCPYSAEEDHQGLAEVDVIQDGIVVYRTHQEHQWHVRCFVCGARSSMFPNPADAIVAWNRVSRAVTLAEEHVILSQQQTINAQANIIEDLRTALGTELGWPGWAESESATSE